MSNKEKDIIKEAKIKAARFCSFRERAPVEVMAKLESYGLSSEQQEDVYRELKLDGFVDEQRFASSFVSGKFRLKKWGKLKIRKRLELLDLDPVTIQSALDLLDQEEYLESMKKHIERKQMSVKESDPFIRNHKVAQSVISRGFEPDMVWSYLKTKQSS